MRRLLGMRLSLFLSLVSAFSFGQTTQVFIGTGRDGIYSAELDEKTGALTKLVRAADEKGNGFLVIEPKGKALYATAKMGEKKGGVISYAIDGGSLKETSRQGYLGRGLCHVSLDATNQVLFAADYGGGSVVSFPVKPDATLGAFASFVKHEGSSVHPQRQKRPHAHSIYPGPGNRFAYAPDLGTDKVEIYSFDAATAKLMKAGAAKVPPGSGARHMKFGKEGKYAYVLNELTLTITVFATGGGGGDLVEVQTLSVLPKGADGSKMSCSEILVSKDGKFVYCANRDLTDQKRDSISVLRVGEGGKLTWLQSAPAMVWIPRNINLTPSGNYLLVAGRRSNEVVVLKVDKEKGTLTFTGHRVPVQEAMCIAFP